MKHDNHVTYNNVLLYEKYFEAEKLKKTMPILYKKVQGWIKSRLFAHMDVVSVWIANPNAELAKSKIIILESKWSNKD